MSVADIASASPVETLSEVIPASEASNRNSQPVSTHDSPSHAYKIEASQQSPSALLLFARQVETDEAIVMKLLHEYRDTRYSLETPQKRHQCQLEAIQRNRIFSPEFYLGLAPFVSMNTDENVIYIGEEIKDPDEELLDPGAEYVLLMQHLPESMRLDYLLETESEEKIKHYLLLLCEQMAAMHARLTALEDGEQWGSYELLAEKRRQNLELLDFLLEDAVSCRAYPILRSTLPVLKEIFEQMAQQDIYRAYFKQRVVEGHIRLCHGDVKSPHIWVMRGDRHGNGQEAMKLLDAIDFNPLFNHIDTLSDFAMLVADVHARTARTGLVNEMVRRYLRLTDQDNEVARAVLGYYIIEKAIVGTAISFLYDGLPILGLRFLDVALSRLQIVCGATLKDIQAVWAERLTYA